MGDRDLMRKLNVAGMALLELPTEVSEPFPANARVLDRWDGEDRGAVLFWIPAEFDVWGFGHGDATLHLVHGRQVDGVWRSSGGGGSGAFSAAEYIAEHGVGLHRFGGGSSDGTRFTYAVASPEVSSIELRSDEGVSVRAPGAEGFCLLGTTEDSPLTHARPLDAAGEPLHTQILLL
jgi:hypothetical protein